MTMLVCSYVPTALEMSVFVKAGWMVQHVQFSGHLFLLAFPRILVGEQIETSKNKSELLGELR